MPSYQQINPEVVEQKIEVGNVESNHEEHYKDVEDWMKRAQQQQPQRNHFAPLKPPAPTDSQVSDASNAAFKKPPFSSLSKEKLLQGLTSTSSSSTTGLPRRPHHKDDEQQEANHHPYEAQQHGATNSPTNWVAMHCEELGVSIPIVVHRSSSNESENRSRRSSLEPLSFFRERSISSVIRENKLLNDAATELFIKSQRSDLSSCTSSSSFHTKRSFDAISLLCDSQIGSYSSSDNISCMRSMKKRPCLSRSSSISSSMEQRPAHIRGMSSCSSMGCISLLSLFSQKSLLSQTIDPLPKPLLISTASGGSTLSNLLDEDDDDDIEILGLERTSSGDSRAFLRNVLAKTDRASAPTPPPPPPPPVDVNEKVAAYSTIMALAEKEKSLLLKKPTTTVQTPSSSKPRYVKAPETKVYYPKTSKDIIFGRGSGSNDHNRTFREEQVGPRRDAYKRGHWKEKEAVVKELIEWVKVHQGGRFLDLDKTGGYYEVTDEAARIKLQKMTNEYLTQEERAAKKAAKKKKTQAADAKKKLMKKGKK